MEKCSNSGTDIRERKSRRLLERKNQQQKEDEMKQKKDNKRQKTLFERRNNVIGRNDIIVDQTYNKIKLEPEDGFVTVKTEPEGHFEAVLMEEPMDDLEIFETAFQNEPVELIDASFPEDEPEVKFVTEVDDIPIVNEATNLEKQELSAIPDSVGTQSSVEISEIAKLRNMLTAMAEDISGLKSKVMELESENHSLQGRLVELEQWKIDTLKFKMLPVHENPETVAYQAVEQTNGLTNGITEPETDVSQLAMDFKILIHHRKKQDGTVDWNANCELLKNCRLVSKEWKGAVDQFIQNDASHVQLWASFVEMTQINSPSPLRFPLSPCSKNVSLFSPFDPASLKYFLVNVNRPSGGYSPVPTRRLEVILSRDHNLEDFKTELFGYLKKYGGEVWYFKISCPIIREEETYFGYVNIVYKALFHLPNLRAFTVNFPTQYWYSNPRAISSENAKEKRFPYLKHLIVVKILKEFPSMFQLLKANSHIQKLYLPGRYFDTTQLNMRTLYELSIGMHELCIGMHEFRLCKMPRFVSWRLETLIIRELNFDGYNNGYFNAVFQKILLLGETLKTLSLEILGFCNYSEGAIEEIELRHLEHLHFRLNDLKPRMMDGLLSKLKLPNLLKVEACYHHNYTYSPFMGWENITNIHEDSVWLKFPRLERVTQVAVLNYQPKREIFLSSRFDLIRRGMPVVRFLFKAISGDKPRW